MVLPTLNCELLCSCLQHGVRLPRATVRHSTSQTTRVGIAIRGRAAPRLTVRPGAASGARAERPAYRGASSTTKSVHRTFWNPPDPTAIRNPAPRETCVWPETASGARPRPPTFRGASATAPSPWEARYVPPTLRMTTGSTASQPTGRRRSSAWRRDATGASLQCRMRPGAFYRRPTDIGWMETLCLLRRAIRSTCGGLTPRAGTAQMSQRFAWTLNFIPIPDCVLRSVTYC